MKVYSPWDYNFFGSAFRSPYRLTSQWIDNNYRKFYEPPVSNSDDFRFPFSVRETSGTRINVTSSTLQDNLKSETSGGSKFVKYLNLGTVDLSSDSETEYSGSENEHSNDVTILHRNVDNNTIAKSIERSSLPNVAPNVTREPNSLQQSPTEVVLTKNNKVKKSTESGLANGLNSEQPNDRKHAKFVLSSRRLRCEKPSQQNTSHRADTVVPSYISEGSHDENYFCSDCSAKEKNLILPEEIKSSSVICPTPSYPAYDYLKVMLHSEERQVDYIKGDGNCFFRALSKVLFTTEECHCEMRQAVVDLIEKYPIEFQQFIDEPSLQDYIVEMRRSGTWATQTEIYAAATLLQRDIYVLSPDPSGEDYNWLLFSPQLTPSEYTSTDLCYITLCHTNANHYDRIAALDGGCDCPLAPPVLSGVIGHVDLTV